MEKAKNEFSWFCPRDADEAWDTLNNLTYLIRFLNEGLGREKIGEELTLSDEGLGGLCLVFDFIEETMEKSLNLLNTKEA
jgi:hypothetical protein